MSLPVFRQLCIHKTSAINVCSRWLATRPNVNTKKLDSNLVLRTLQTENGKTRPLVIMFSWLMAKEKHIAKYGNLYASEGFDVLSIRVSPTEVLRPKKAQSVIDRVLDVLDQTEQKNKPLLVHGFSVGGYVCGEMMIKLEEEDKYANIRKRLQGQIFDSPVDFVGIPTGFSNVLSENQLIRKMVKYFIQSYLKLFNNTVTKHYLKSSNAFHTNSLGLPSLMLYSRADPIGVDKIIETVIDKWRANGYMVQTKCWENTPHVSHFHHHSDEYVEAILTFMESVGLSAAKLKKDDRLEMKF